MLAVALGFTIGRLSAPTTGTSSTQGALVDLREVEKELSSIRATLEGLLTKPAPVLRADAGDPSSLRAPEPPRADRRVEPAQLTPVEHGSLAALNPEPVQEVGDWKEKEAVRRKWLFSPEESVLKTLGTPSRIYTAQGVDNEYWVYELDESAVTLTFRHGRLLDVKTEGKR